jgi:diaminohydroxyphosphoribosylaminopyrimidine deaminase / 5-amino-6-(5-phosphoribosylamino)uracil reductase
MATWREVDAMRRAIALSAFGLGTTSPNPPVGCVILDADGRVVGQGYHERKGEAHAEAHALASAGGHAAGGTAVVTLEPCNHQGRTPPCRQALIDSEVTRVVIAVIDPTSRAEGGAAALRAAGIDVEVGVLADEARLVLGPWLAALETHRPYMRWAHVLGGGEPIEAFDVGRRLRKSSDVVLFEDGRVEEGVPDGHGKQIFQINPKPLSAGAAAFLTSLHDGGVRSVFLAGGPALAEPFLRDGLVDQIDTVLPGGHQQGQPLIDTRGELWSFAPPGFALVRVENTAAAITATFRRT